YAAVNGLPPETRKPVEQYPGELEHLRELLAAVGRTAPQSDASNPLTEILIDHYSDARIVDAQLAAEDHDGPGASELREMDQADEAALDAAAEAEFAADTEGQR
ncbi:hypothetical protein V2S66_03055, partial [Streptomyces sp. V4-01]|nr:hypothetical protein [Streptomyces sp. V4-01]